MSMPGAVPPTRAPIPIVPRSIPAARRKSARHNGGLFVNTASASASASVSASPVAADPPPGPRAMSDDEDDDVDSRQPRKRRMLEGDGDGDNGLVEDMANFGRPTLLQRTLGLQADRYSQYIGSTTDFEPSLINLSPFDPHNESLLSRGTLRKVSDNDTFLLLPDSHTPGYAHVVDDVDQIESIVAPHGRTLLRLYFRVVHPSFPILQKTVFVQQYDRSYRDVSPPVLAAVYILAINWWDHADELASVPKPNVRALETLVRTTLADAMYRPKLSTVQAGLLLSQRPEGDQWAPTAQLVAIAQELGLHLDASHWKIPPWERGLRKRLAWALYMQDKWGALVHGRPSHIFPSNWAVPPLRPTDFPDIRGEGDEDGNDEGDEHERADLERGRSLFAQMVQLTHILAEILETLYTLQANQVVAQAGVQGYQLVLALARPIQLKLKAWYDALPASLRVDSLASLVPSGEGPAVAAAQQRLSSVGYLHLAYFATEITLHRRILRSLEASAAAGAGVSGRVVTGSSAPASSTRSIIDPYVENMCRSAAKARLIAAMDFVNRLTPLHLRAFWYFASKTHFALIGTFGSLLWATSPGREEADWYRRRLGEYRWTLSVSSNQPGEATKGLTEFAMGMLDISTGLLKQLPVKPLLSRSTSARSPDTEAAAAAAAAARRPLHGERPWSEAQSPGSQTDDANNSSSSSMSSSSSSGDGDEAMGGIDSAVC